MDSVSSRSTQEKKLDGFQNAGILVHGCHLKAKDWEGIVWGRPPYELGRIPRAVLLAYETNATVVVFSTGASEKDGVKECVYTMSLMFERFSQLHDFDALRHIDLDEMRARMKEISVTEAESQNTQEDVMFSARLAAKRGATCFFMVSSPTHICRCLLNALVMVNTPEFEMFKHRFYATSSDTPFAGSTARDVVIIEPPHRPDRDTVPLHLLAKRICKIPETQRALFAQRCNELLTDFGV